MIIESGTAPGANWPWSGGEHELRGHGGHLGVRCAGDQRRGEVDPALGRQLVAWLEMFLVFVWSVKHVMDIASYIDIYIYAHNYIYIYILYHSIIYLYIIYKYVIHIYIYCIILYPIGSMCTIYANIPMSSKFEHVGDVPEIWIRWVSRHFSEPSSVSNC